MNLHPFVLPSFLSISSWQHSGFLNRCATKRLRWSRSEEVYIPLKLFSWTPVTPSLLTSAAYVMLSMTDILKWSQLDFS